jgi:hypothetical protein
MNTISVTPTPYLISMLDFYSTKYNVHTGMEARSRTFLMVESRVFAESGKV